MLFLISAGTLLQESFETSVPPTGWEIIDLGSATGDSWYRTATKAHSGDYSAKVNYVPSSNAKDEWLVTPAIDLSSVSAAYLIFYEDEDYWAGYGDHHQILVSTTSQTDTSTFTLVLDMTPSDHNINGFDGDPVVVDLSSFAGSSTVYVAFRYTGTDADNWYIDDVEIYAPYNEDARPVALTNPEYQPSTFTPTVRIQNYGLDTLNAVPVRLVFEDPYGNVAYDNTVTYSGTLGPMDTATLSFPDFTPNNLYYYRYTIITQLPGDENASNDTVGGYIYAYDRPMMVLFERFTQHNCGPCHSADPYQLSIYGSHIDASGYHIGMITYHAWWPGSNNDPFYKYDTMPQRNRILYYRVNAVPWVYINGVVNASYFYTQWASYVASEETYRKTPLEFIVDSSTSNTYLYEDSAGIHGRITFTVHQFGAMVPKAYRMRVVIVQDSVHYNAPNGTNFHVMKFRHWIDTAYTPTDTGGTTTYSLDFFLPHPTWYSDPGLDINHTVAVLFIQSDDDHKVWGVGTFSFANSVDVAESPKGTGYWTAKVLPVRGGVRLYSSQERATKVRIYDATGRLVAERTFNLKGETVYRPALPKGVYFYEVRIGGRKWYGRLLRF